MMNASRIFRFALLGVLAALLAAMPSCYADAPNTLCSVVGYKILSSNSIAIQCGGVDTSGISGEDGKVFLGTDLASPPLPVKLTVTPYPFASRWLFVLLTPGSGTGDVLKAKTKYTIQFTLSRAGTGDKGATSIDRGSTSTQIDTSGSLTLEAALVGGPNNYRVTSNLAFQRPGPGTDKNGKNALESCTFIVQDYTAAFSTRHAKCKQAQVDISNDRPGLPDPFTVGTLQLLPEGTDLATQGIPYAITGLENVLGAPITLDPKARLGQEQAPATKDASSYYVNASFSAGRGSKPGWVVDAKAAPPIGSPFHGWQFSPTATANIGHNSVSGTTYTDTIDLGLTEARPLELSGALAEIYASGSFVYETDREFDRDNLTGVADLRYNFRQLYSPRAVEALRLFGERQKIAKSHEINLQPGDVSPPFLGHALDFHTGIEFGGAAVDTTVKATTGKATIVLPAYSIFRIVPQVHGLLELGRLSIDATGTPRYLAATENTVVQLPNNTLQLKTVQGWHGYGVVTPAFSLDPAGHFSVSATYKDGFAPPKFARINAVQLGILVKY